MSTQTIVRGTPYGQPRRIVKKFDPTRGYYDSYLYECATQGPLIALQNDLNNLGWITELTLENDRSSLTAEDPTQQFNVDTWQLQGNDLQIDGLSHPQITGILSDEQISVIRAGINNAQASDDNSGTKGIIATILANKIFQNKVPPLTGAKMNLVAVYIGLQFKGSDNFLRAQYVLKHTTNVANRYPVNIAENNVLSIYPLANLLNEIVNGGWTNPCPIPLQNAISLATTGLASSFYVAANDPNYSVGWLKKPSTQTTTAYNRIDIETEYILDFWSTNGNGGAGYYPILT